MSVLDEVLGLKKKVSDFLAKPITYNRDSLGGKAIDALMGTAKAASRKMDAATEGFVSGSTLGLANPQFVSGERTAGDKAAHAVGNVIGLVNPLNPINKLMAGVGKAGATATKAGVSKLAPKASSKAGQIALEKLLPALGSEVAQTAAYTGAQAATGQKITPVENLAMGLAGRGIGGAGEVQGLFKIPKLGKKTAQVIKAMHPDDIYELDRAVEAYNGPVIGKALDVAKKNIDRLAEAYLSPKQITQAKGDKTKLIKMLQKVAGADDGRKGDYVIPGMGFTGETRPQKPQTLNTKRLDLNPEQQAHVASLESTEPKTVLKNKEVIKQAEGLTGKDRVITTEKTAELSASELANRQKVVSLEKQFQELKTTGADPKQLEEVTAEIARASKVARSEGTDAARRLQARSILADEMASPMQRVFKLLDNAGVDAEKYGREASKVNWDDANSVVDFYRKYVPPKFGDLLDEYRYTNMLSSPKTWITNLASNVIQTGVQPVRKAIAGGFDWAISGLTGRERQQFASEAAPFVKNALSALPRAFREAADALTGKQGITNLDLEHIPSGNKFMKAYSFPSRVLEAGDMFFRNILQSGEEGALKYRAERLGKDVDLDTIMKQSKDYALETVFRGELNKQGQGWMLDAIDSMTKQIQSLRNADSKLVKGASRLIIPFVQTPMNILKQGVEYSPLEFANMIKSGGDTADQLAKATIGSMVMAGAGMMAAAGNSTWDEPTNATERAEFYAAGKQAYSLRVGDKWVSYSKLGPLAYPIAMAAAIHQALKTRGEDEQALVTGGRIAAMVGGFFTDQSYMQSIGDIIDALQGDEFKQTRLIASVPQQLVPFRAFQGWVAKVVDPIYRKVDWKDGIPQAIFQSIQSQTPFASKGLPAYQTPFGEDSQRQFPLINSVSPFSITKENPVENQYFEQQNARREQTRQENQLKKQLEEGKASSKASNLPTDKRLQMADAVFKLRDLRAMPESTAYEKSLKEGKVFTKIDDILNSEDFSDEEKSKIVESLGVSRDDADYYNVARQTEQAKTAFVTEALGRAQGNGIDALKLLANMRRDVNGKMILSTGVIDELADGGLISKDQAKELKKYQYNQTSKSVQYKKSGSAGKKAKKVTIQKLGSIKPVATGRTPSTVKQPTFRKRKSNLSKSLDQIVFGK